MTTMTTRHEPREGFAERLEWQIATEVRRRNRAAEAPGWMPRSPLRAALAAGLLVIVSMVAGGVAVAAAYQVRANEQRDLIAAGIELRLGVAQKRLEAARAERAEAEKRVATGLDKRESLLVADQAISQAEAEIVTLKLQIEEVRLTGREPRPEITAPVVSGRDFVALRLETEIGVATGALGLERTRLQAWETRFNVGLANADEVATAQARLVEIEAAVTALRQKLEARRRFTSGAITATQADLRVLEVEAEQRIQALGPKLALAKNLLQQLVLRAEIGTSAPVDVAQARLRVAEVEAELAKARLDLMLIRKRQEE
jgi:hypothetical protein